MRTNVHTQRLVVSLEGHKVGELGQHPNGRIQFQYDDAWLSTGFPLTKLMLKFAPGLQSGDLKDFWYLHGVFNDSLPDGWGLRLMDRALKAAYGWDWRSITGLDRLAYIGNRGMGALEYAPARGDQEADFALDLAELARAADMVDAGNDRDILKSLIIHGGSGGGARPKVTVARNVSDGRCVSGFQPLLPGYEHWLVKFRHHLEPRDTGRAERAYAHMAESAGLVVPQTDLIAMRLNGKGEAFFASKRFDREGDRKIHMLSLAGLLHASHREPCVEYEGTLAATRLLTQSQTEVVRMFRQMVFNVVTYNRDDHTKNFAFLYRDGSWKVSPAFDLAMSPNAGMNFHHMSAVNGESRHPTLGDVMAVADQFDIADAKHVVAEVIEAASGWKAFASLYDVGSETTSDIEERIGEMIEAMRPPTTPRPRGR